MTITTGLTNSYALELQQGVHSLLTDTLMFALYDGSTTLDPASMTAYTATGEVTGTGYSAGGVVLSGKALTQDATTGIVMFTFTSPSWAASTISAAGGLIYNASKSNKSIAVVDFGGTVASIANTFRFTVPAVTVYGAIMRLQPR